MLDCETQYQAAPLNVKIYKYSYFLLQTLGTVSRILEQLDSQNLALEPVKFWQNYLEVSQIKTTDQG